MSYPALPHRRLGALLPCVWALLLAVPGAAQDGMEDVFGGFGTATAEGGAGRQAGDGTVTGRVFDAATGQPLERVTVLLKHPVEPGVERRRDVQISDIDGGFEFPSVPPGLYDVTFIKAGYRNSTMTDFEVVADEVSRADFPLPPAAAGASSDVLQLEDFVVEADTAADMVTSLETRLDSDQIMNVLTADDFSKFASSDVADALRRVAGVSIQGGEFAIIRGLEDRYSSVLFNGAPVPSPDPDRQSVQLDLFPSEIVSGLTVAKTFSPELPSNSSGGSIDILTAAFPDRVQFSFKAGTGWNDRAVDNFIKFDGRSKAKRIVNGLGDISDDDFQALLDNGFNFIGGNPVGIKKKRKGSFFDDVSDVLESDFVATLGGRHEFGGREFRLRVLASTETDYDTSEGWRNRREPRPPDETAPFSFFDFGCFCTVDVPGVVNRTGDLAFGKLGASDGLFDVTISQKTEQDTGFAAFGFDLDDEGGHRIDVTGFYTEKDDEISELRENGSLPGFDYQQAVDLQLAPSQGLPEQRDAALFADASTIGSFVRQSIQARNDSNSPINRGGLAWGSFLDSASFQRERELWVVQLNGDHVFEPLPGLHVSWAWNHAETEQKAVNMRMQFFYEPCGHDPLVTCPEGVDRLDPNEIIRFPLSVNELGPGSYVANNELRLNANRIEEESDFARVDADYEYEFSESSRFQLAGGVWLEEAERDVNSVFLDNPEIQRTTEDAICSTGGGGGGLSFACLSDTPLGLGRNVFGNIGSTQRFGLIRGIFPSTVVSDRDIDAWHLRGKLTVLDRLDFLGGVRREEISIITLNNPFIRDPVTGEFTTFLGGPITFPSRYLLFDRFDNPFINEVSEEKLPDENTVFPDQIVGTGVVPGPCAGDDGSIPGIQCVDFQSVEELSAFLNGKIDEKRWLPSAGITLRPLPGMSLRGAYSQTVARPSFRELGFYPSVQPGRDEITVGNPALQLSDVESWDFRAEYNWGEYGDLLAVSYFNKTIDDPIESLIIRDPANSSTDSTALIRTFFNNRNTADLQGVEVEGRMSFGVVRDLWNSGPEWLRYLSVGGNYTYIDAEVGRSPLEVLRAQSFFTALEEDEPTPFRKLADKRRLFGQPEWIANADITFDHPDWGTRLTFAYFGISDILDAAGSVNIQQNGDVIGLVLDRYIDSYDEFRLITTQRIDLPGELGVLQLRFSIKNLTDSRRRTVYDPAQTSGTIPEQSLRIGRRYDFSATYTFEF